MISKIIAFILSTIVLSGGYVVRVQDLSGAPIADVNVKICTDTTCELATTNQIGVIVYHGEPYQYEAHVISAPDGYKTTDESFTFPENGGEIVITLENE